MLIALECVFTWPVDASFLSGGWQDDSFEPFFLNEIHTHVSTYIIIYIYIDVYVYVYIYLQMYVHMYASNVLEH